MIEEQDNINPHKSKYISNVLPNIYFKKMEIIITIIVITHLYDMPGKVCMIHLQNHVIYQISMFHHSECGSENLKPFWVVLHTEKSWVPNLATLFLLKYQVFFCVDHLLCFL